MKKRKIANLIMVLMITAIVIAGVATAIALKTDNGDSLGSQYETKAFQNDVFVEPEQENACTITIVCDTILDNPGNLNPEKSPYVPEDGTILPKTTVSFAQGDNAFEVLKNACEAAGIQLEYSYTPAFESYYIEGIGHLYEFDCGPESGWMYSVNGQFPSYGCSAYKLQNGDDIVWSYTCSGLGTDVGASGMG